MFRDVNDRLSLYYVWYIHSFVICDTRWTSPPPLLLLLVFSSNSLWPEFGPAPLLDMLCGGTMYKWIHWLFGSVHWGLDFIVKFFTRLSVHSFHFFLFTLVNIITKWIKSYRVCNKIVNFNIYRMKCDKNATEVLMYIQHVHVVWS